MTSNYQKVLSGRRVSLPKESGISEGDIVIVERDRRGTLIIPTEVRPKT
jgi:hypothetical protein